ncbi:hypothetical protein PMIN01_10894 [Paraphaeosphaeria minitans]|uniref:Uncharacterized protein n=1 Tax=Paraphaeosphaeria minitans TaxID=565426 RepID=A0A9P6G972_9PLEO|nr:hypothetical protein PMIN01_10894 [Paraphaeosphaeria minitans]
MSVRPSHTQYRPSRAHSPPCSVHCAGRGCGHTSTPEGRPKTAASDTTPCIIPAKAPSPSKLHLQLLRAQQPVDLAVTLYEAFPQYLGGLPTYLPTYRAVASREALRPLFTASLSSSWRGPILRPLSPATRAWLLQAILHTDVRMAQATARFGFVFIAIAMVRSPPRTVQCRPSACRMPMPLHLDLGLKQARHCWAQLHLLPALRTPATLETGTPARGAWDRLLAGLTDP